jgi:hypothetical protein
MSAQPTMQSAKPIALHNPALFIGLLTPLKKRFQPIFIDKMAMVSIAAPWKNVDTALK